MNQQKGFLKLKMWICVGLFLSLSALAQPKSKVVKGVDYIYMHIGLQMTHPLPPEFKKERLKFEGNCEKYTSSKYKPASNEIHFRPRKKGSCIMIIKNAKQKIISRLHIDVQKDNLHKIAAELKDLLIAVDGIEVKIYNKKVIIDGQILLPREMTRIKDVIAQYDPSLVQSLVTYSPEAQKKIADIIEKEIGYPEVTVRYAYNRFLLEGCVSSEDERNRAISIANLYTQFDVSPVGKGASRRNTAPFSSELTVPCESEKREEEEKQQKSEIKKLIQIVVHFVEMNKSFNKGFMFQWTPAIDGSGTRVTASVGNASQQKGISALLTATVSNFFPKLNWAKSFGFARVLHNSSLLVENENEGTINISTQVPSQTLENGTQISGGVQAGIQTTIRPTIIGERDNLIHMTVQIGVSSPASKDAVTSRTINTVIHVRDGSSAVVGGVISSFLNRDYNRNPAGLEGAQPILNLYSGKNYDTTKSQFVVFITPIIKSSASLDVDRIKQKFRLDE